MGLRLAWLEGWAKRWLNSPFFPPATWGIRPSKTVPAGLVDVHPEVEQVAEEASALGRPEGVDALDVTSAGVAVPRGTIPQEGGEVADGGQAQPNDRGSGSAVDDLVNPAGLKSVGHVRIGRIRRQLSIHHPGKGPLFPRDDRLGSVLVVLDGEVGVGIVQVRGRIGPVVPVGKELFMDQRVGLEGYYKLPRDGRTVGFQSTRRVEPHNPRSVGGVVLPAAPYDGVTLPHQEPVAHIRGLVGGQIGSVVEVAQRRAPSPVQNVEEDPVVATGGVLRLEDAEVGGEPDQPCLVPVRQLQVGDEVVGWMEGVHGEIGRTVNLDVGTHLSEGCTLGQGLPVAYFQRNYRHFLPPLKSLNPPQGWVVVRRRVSLRPVAGVSHEIAEPAARLGGGLF